MSTVQWGLLTVIVLVVAWLVYDFMVKRLTASSTPPPAPPLPGVLSTVLIGTQLQLHVGDGQSIKGVVQMVAPDHVTLAGASIIAPGGAEASLKGRCRVPLDPIVLVQELEQPPGFPPPPSWTGSED